MLHGGYAFGPFVVDTVKRRLWRDGRAVPLSSKTFDVLVVLLERREHLVSKEDLLNDVWPNIAVNENNLARQISSLRRALGQRPDQHDFLVTVPGQGYRFVAAVRELPSVPSDGPAESETSDQIAHAPALEFHEDAPDAEHPATSPMANSGAGVLDEAPSSSPVGFWPIAAALAATAAVLATVLTVAVLRRDRPAPEPRRAMQRITYDEATVPRQASWSPDGRWIVYAADRAGNADLWKQRPGDPDPVRLTASDVNESQPQWSPDGRSIVFRSERDGGGLYVISADGGVERIVSSFGYEPQWSPDGTLILFKGTAVLPDLPSFYVAGLDGRPPRAARPDVFAQFTAAQAAWHPDGRRISIWGTTRTRELRFVTVPIEEGKGRVAEAQMAAPVRRAFESVAAGRFIWGRSGRFVYFEGRTGEIRNIWRVRVDPATQAWLEAPERLTTAAGEETNLALSPDGGRLVFTSTSNRTRLWAFPLDLSSGRITGAPQPITDGSTGEVDFDARTDGSKVAYRTVRAGRSELWERSIADGRQRLLLASTDALLLKPRWSPDGAQLAFSRCARPDNRLALAVLDAAGGGSRVLTQPNHVDMQGFDWSHDGRAILGSCRFGPSERYSTCLVPVSLQGGDAEPTVRVIASDPNRNLYNQRFSPDQRWITFLAHDLSYASTSAIYVIPAAGGSWRAITDGSWFDDKPRWGPDGRILYFVSNRSGVANVWGRRFDDRTGTPIGEVFPVTSFRSAQFVLTPRTVQMDIAVTATHLLLPMTEARSEIWMLDQVDR